MNTQVMLNLQIACKKTNNLPKKHQFQLWLNAAILGLKTKSSVNIRLVDKKESCFLNLSYRKVNKPTNILSFSFITPSCIKTSFLGDLVICSHLIEFEAKKQRKLLEEHWAHVVIHGCLHLLGYHHDNSREFKRMKYLETKIMISLGYRSPYLVK